MPPYPWLVEIAVNVRGNDGEVRLAQPVHHLSHEASRFRHGGRAFDLRAKFVMHRGPVDAAELGSQYWS